ncbi:MAG: N-acetylmuramic acid 6-phosphate etherase [Cereibacter changlensis]
MTDRPTEARHPAAEGLHALPATELLRLALAGHAAAVAVVERALPAIGAAAEVAAEALLAGGRMVYAGAGSSGLMALADCLELLGTFGIPPDRTPMLFAGGAGALLHLTGAVEDDPALAQADTAALGLTAKDVVICLSASGSTPYTLLVAEAARAAGAQVVGIANVPGSALLRLADLPIWLETGPEIVAGSTRLGAATAQKVALNLMSVLVGIRLGHVHDGYMVNLEADNAKLIERAARIVAGISGAAPETAHAALEASRGAVKPAVLIAAGATPEAAATALQDTRGHLGPALARIGRDQ